jgi:hypothetical protein
VESPLDPNRRLQAVNQKTSTILNLPVTQPHSKDVFTVDKLEPFWLRREGVMRKLYSLAMESASNVVSVGQGADPRSRSPLTAVVLGLVLLRQVGLLEAELGLEPPVRRQRAASPGGTCFR